MTRRRLLILGWLLVLALTATLPLSALFHGIVHLGPSRYVAHGMLTKPVIALGSDVVLPAGSREVVVDIGGNVVLNGRARDDLVSAGGRVYLAPHSHVDADVLALFGGIYKGTGVHVRGRLGGALYPWDGRRTGSQWSVTSAVANSVRLGLAAGLALLLIGTCITVVFPWQVVLISTTMRASPMKSVAAGLMCLLTFVFLVVPLGLSLAGLPFALLLTAAATLAWLFGLTASAIVLGRMISRGPVSLLWATAAGLLILALGMTIPLIGPMLVSLIGLTGAGALAVALLSRSRPATLRP